MEKQSPTYNNNVSYADAPPPYTPQGYNPYPQGYISTPQVVVVEKNSPIFHQGARFNGISTIGIPPPPPGCLPNQYQMMQMNGHVDVVMSPDDPRITLSRGHGLGISKNQISPK